MAMDALELDVESLILENIDSVDSLALSEMVQSFINRQVRWSA